MIDTNVAVSLWIDNDWTASARRLLAHDPDWRTEPYALIEFSNVMTTYVRTRRASARQAERCLAEAEQLLAPGLQPVAHRSALQTAVKFSVSAYDARFLAAARELGVKLVTEDAKLRRAAPVWTQSIEQALSV